MNTRPLYEEITLVHAGYTVRLRPSLRAASILERRYDGFPALFKRVDEFHLGAINEIILAASLDRQDAAAFLHFVRGKPLSHFFQIVHAPIVEFCRLLIPASSTGSKLATGKPMTWAEVYRQLYISATGWLNWTPDAAWNATPNEITEAANEYFVKLNAIHGSGEDTKDNTPTDPEQAARNIEAGLDPDFDRTGLRALKARLAASQ